MSKVYALDVQPDSDMDVLKQFTDQEVLKTATEVLKLHRKLGHPSRQAFVKMLRDRGASLLVRTLASIVHGQDCQESAIPPSRRAVTIEKVCIDEASGYGAATFFSNIQFPKVAMPPFGYPRILKLDKESAHRGRELEEWAEGHGLEVIAIPAESHGHIGRVERLIGTLKNKLLSHLRSSDASPEAAVWSMIGAHNHMANIAGYIAAQWVFGRNFSDADRLHDSPDLPLWSGMQAMHVCSTSSFASLKLNEIIGRLRSERR